MEIFDILNLVIGVLCLYWAIVGKGYPYKVNYPTKIRAYSNKLIRLTLFLEGPITLFLFAIPQFARNENGGLGQPWLTIYLIVIILAVIVIALYIILLYSKYGEDILAINKNNQTPKYYK